MVKEATCTPKAPTPPKGKLGVTKSVSKHDELLKLFPLCPVHGLLCVPHITAWSRGEMSDCERQHYGDQFDKEARMKFVEGGFQVEHPIIAHICKEMADLLANSEAENFVVMEYGTPEHGSFTCEIKRKFGKSPAMVIGEMRDKIAELEAKLQAPKADALGDIGKPFHRPECVCSKCEDWRKEKHWG